MHNPHTIFKFAHGPGHFCSEKKTYFILPSPVHSGASEVCKQCMDSGARYGQRKRTKELVAWAKKKRKLIRRDELLAFLMDKPYQQQQSSGLNPTTTNDDSAELSPVSNQKPPPPPPGFMQGHCPASFGPISSPRRRALLKDEPPSRSNDGEIYGIGGKEGSGRKRTASSTSGTSIFDFNMLGPDCKRMRLWCIVVLTCICIHCYVKRYTLTLIADRTLGHQCKLFRIDSILFILLALFWCCRYECHYWPRPQNLVR